MKRDKMSKATQDKFIRFIDHAVGRLSSEFSITNKNVVTDGYVTRISYSFGDGLIEFLCGPPEYQTELFITVQDGDQSVDRYDLAKLLSIPRLRKLIEENRPDISHGDKMKAEVDRCVLLLKEVKNLREFQSLS